jgi:hypothetical protein
MNAGEDLDTLAQVRNMTAYRDIICELEINDVLWIGPLSMQMQVVERIKGLGAYIPVLVNKPNRL